MSVDDALEAFRAEAARLREEGMAHLAYLIEHDVWLIEMARKTPPPEGRPILCAIPDSCDDAF